MHTEKYGNKSSISKDSRVQHCACNSVVFIMQHVAIFCDNVKHFILLDTVHGNIIER